MVVSGRRDGSWLAGVALEDDEHWRRMVWSDFIGALALCALMGGLLALASSCT